MKLCHACGAEITATEKIPRTEECPSCGRDLHSCRNCRHYNPAVHNQCEEPVAEWISDKERANFCDYFFFREAEGPRNPGSSRTLEEDAREKWKRLFKA